MASTTARGYGWAHQRKRAQWKPQVDAGQAYCHAVVCLKGDRWIEPGTPWHLGHTPDRSSWTGPEHEQCNESDGARRGNQQRRRAPARTVRTVPLQLRTSRRW
jgi:hypothetical protein